MKFNKHINIVYLDSTHLNIKEINKAMATAAAIPGNCVVQKNWNL